MRHLLLPLAMIRAILLIVGMVMFMMAYAVSCIFIPHNLTRALRLRKSYLKFWAIPVLNIRVHVKSKPKTQPAVFVSNHRSFVDPIVICRYLNAFVIAKAEVASYPVINKGAELTGIIWVDRDSKDSRVATREKMIETIQQGYNILVFPEGTVGKERHTLPFRKGTFWESAEHDIPVSPIAIEYKSELDLWVIPNFLLQFFRQFSKWETVVSLTFGEQMTSGDGDLLHDNAYQWINTTIETAQKSW